MISNHNPIENHKIATHKYIIATVQIPDYQEINLKCTTTSLKRIQTETKIPRVINLLKLCQNIKLN
jgi:hypothetical protein